MPIVVTVAIPKVASTDPKFDPICGSPTVRTGGTVYPIPGLIIL